MNECIFCNKIINDKPEFENELVVGYYDKYPVSKGHVILITKRHIRTYFEMSKDEEKNMFELLRKVKEELDKKYKPDGYNIGFNCEEAAGQTIMHVHLHLIPRYIGDVNNPRGGVRGVIPSKQNY